MDRKQTGFLDSQFKNVPIKWKLVFIILFASVVTLVSAIIIFSFYDSKSAYENKRIKTKIISEVVGLNSIPALQFNDRDDALEILQSLKAEDSIRAAYLFSAEGMLVAEYLAPGEELEIPVSPENKQSEAIGSDKYSLIHPIILDGKTAGILHITSDLADLSARNREMWLHAATVGACGLAIAILLALWLQAILTRPIQALQHTIEEVRKNKDYSLRADVDSKDEFGSLVMGFNHMLAEVQGRDGQLSRQMLLLEESNKELDQRVAERTRELESSNKELESFSYSVSHDLRAPLRSINGFSQILLEDHFQNLSKEAQRILGIILTDVKKMGCLIDDLLAFSRMNRQVMSRGLIDMTTLAEEVYKEIVSRIPGDKIDFKLSKLPESSGDRSMLKQVFINLISNAVKFTSTREKPLIEVRGESDGKFNYYQVKDNGVGYDSRYQDKLFKVFQRLHTDQEFEGTGVGLALVQRIVERHGGSVSSTSELGNGAIFRFSVKVEQDFKKPG